MAAQVRRAVACALPAAEGGEGLQEKMLVRMVSVDSESTVASPRSSTASSAPSLSEASDCSEVVGRVWELSRHAQGSRLVQAALDMASQEQREVLALELRGGVAKAARCPHGNHVLQKCVAVLRPEALQFIVEELLAREGLVSQIARHRYGCRVVNHLLRRCPPQQLSGLTEALLAEALVLACHTFGQFAIRELLELGSEEVRYRLVRALEQNMGAIGRSKTAGGVVMMALTHAAPEDKVWVARAAAQDPAVLLQLATVGSGEAAVVQVLRLLRGRELEAVTSYLSAHTEELRRSRAARAVLEELEVR